MNKEEEEKRKIGEVKLNRKEEEIRSKSGKKKEKIERIKKRNWKR
jgi:hypothetical protein